MNFSHFWCQHPARYRAWALFTPWYVDKLSQINYSYHYQVTDTMPDTSNS